MLTDHKVVRLLHAQHGELELVFLGRLLPLGHVLGEVVRPVHGKDGGVHLARVVLDPGKLLDPELAGGHSRPGGRSLHGEAALSVRGLGLGHAGGGDLAVGAARGGRGR